jgi:hypothetical protein
LEDQALQDFARERGAVRQCDYCNRIPETAGVVPLADLTLFMRKAIAAEWCHPDETNSFSSAAEGYMAPIFDAYEVFEEIGFEVANPALMEDIVAAFAGQPWCQRNWEMLSPSRRCMDGWGSFQYFVKHKRRYSFWYAQDFDDDDFARFFYANYLPPSKLLDEIASVVNHAALVKSVAAGTIVWRLRLHSRSKVPAVPEEFTSPPIDHAKQPNRMSPAGVPMFYGADEFDTALRELVDPNQSDPDTNGKAFSGLQFRNMIPVNLLDLSSVPSPPSYFSPGDQFRRHLLIFLPKFASDLAQPITRDERQHIEYVPTQVFTEFVRHIMKGPGGAPIHGIRYRSSRDGKPCCVIFATQAECLAPRGPFDFTTQILEFVPGSLKTIEIP